MNPDTRDLAIHVLIACVGVTWLVVLWRADRNPVFKNFSLLGFITTRDGYPDRPGFLEMATWFAYTLMLFVLVLHDHLTEFFAVIYVAFPAVRAGQVAWLHAGNPQPPVHEEEPQGQEHHDDRG